MPFLCALGAGQIPASRLLPARILHLLLPAEGTTLLMQTCTGGEAEIRHQLLQVH